MNTNTQNPSYPAPAQKVVPVAEPVAQDEMARLRAIKDDPTRSYGDRCVASTALVKLHLATPAASVPAGGERKPIEIPCADLTATQAAALTWNINAELQARAIDLWVGVMGTAAQPILAQDAKDARSTNIAPEHYQRLSDLSDEASARFLTDAADGPRYRWLRDKSQDRDSFYLSVPKYLHGVKFTRKTVDDAIDAAILSSEQDQGGGGT